MRAGAVPVVRYACWLLPVSSLALLVLMGAQWRAVALCVVWCALALTTRLSFERRQYDPVRIYLAQIALCGLPFALASLWVLAGPIIRAGSATLLAWTSLLPALCDALWRGLGDRTKGWRWLDAVVLPAISVVVALLATEIVGVMVLAEDPFRGNISTNSPDRSYWYVVRRVDPSGVASTPTYGFVGPEPDVTFSGLRVLVIGDSIPDATKPVNFAKIAETLLTQQGAGRIQFVNAAIYGYSLEQMKRFYAERLGTLRHDILVISFYLDDINRELRYRKRNRFYTPSWPEWMQDVYHQCFVCRTLLTASGFTESVFLLHRTRGRVESVPAALHILDEIRALAMKRGAVVAVLNVPIFDWPDVLPSRSAYRFSEINDVVDTWASERKVYYLDLLPILVGRDIRPLRRSATDIHFTDEGHRFVGAALKRLIDEVIDQERLHDRLTADRS